PVLAKRTAPSGNGGWQKFEGRPPASPVQTPQSPRYSSGSTYSNQNRYTPPANVDRSSGYRGGYSNSPQSVRISPPMVRERPAAPRYESAPRPSGNSNSGGGSHGNSGGEGSSHSNSGGNSHG